MTTMTRQQSRPSSTRLCADGRTSLSAPEAKQVADAYGIPTPGEGLATTAEGAAGLAARDRLPRRAEDRLAGHPAQDRRRRRGGRRATREDGARRRSTRSSTTRKAYKAGRGDHRRPGAEDAVERRPGGHRRRGHRPDVRQGGRVRAGWRPGRGAQGRHLPPRPAGRATRRASMVDGDQRGRDAARASAAREPVDKDALARPDRARLRPGHRLPASSPRSTSTRSGRPGRRHRGRLPDHRGRRGRQAPYRRYARRRSSPR